MIGMMGAIRLAGMVLCALSGGCATRSAAAVSASTPGSGDASAAPTRDSDRLAYRIRPRDLVQILVYEHPDLSLSVRAGEDGEVLLPLVGAVRAVGRTEQELARELQARLADGYVVRPYVLVSVGEYRDNFWVTGEVTRPGAYRYEHGLTVRKALTLAGGTTARANERRIRLVREGATPTNGTGPGTHGAKPAARTLEPALDDAVQPGDIIVVPAGLL
jgi:polysaccharide export outer membrane protein